MKTQIYSGALLLLATTCLFSCKKDDSKTMFSESLNSYVKQLPSVQQIAPFAEREVVKSSLTSKYMKATPVAVSSEEKEFEQAVPVEEQLLFSEDQEIFYPGALVKAGTVVGDNGSYQPISAPRKPLKISVSLIGDNPSITVNNPTLSSVRESVSTLLSRKFDTPPANISFHSEEVHDEQHLKIALGANYAGTSTQVKASTGFKYDKDKKRFLVKVQQVFYTMDVDIPVNPSDFFADDFDYQTAFGKEKPVYISSIKMGRVLLLGVETTMTKADFEAKLQASFLGGKLSGEAEAAFQQINEKSTIKGKVLGGTAALGGKSISDISKIKEFLEEGASFGKDNPGIPIAYRMRELGTNNSFKTIIYSKYYKKPEPNQKMNFSIFIHKNDLGTVSGTKLEYTGRAFLEISSKGETKIKEELKFGEKANLSEFIAKDIKSFESGDKITITFDRTKITDQYNEEIIFELPSFESLLERSQQVGDKNLYDKQDGSPLQLKDKTKKYNLVLELEKQKIF